MFFPVRMEPPSRRALAHAAFLTVAMLFISGCAAFGRKGPVDQHVIQSRQLTQQAHIAIHKQQWDRAEDSLLRAIEFCPQDGNARRCLADVLWNRGATEAAIEQMGEALALAGDGDVDLSVRLGQMHLARGNLKEALQLADQAINIDRRHSAAWQLRGDVQQQRGQFDDALSSFFQALSLHGDRPEVRLAIAEIYQRQGQPGRALATLQAIPAQWAADNQPERILLLKGLALISLGRSEDAAEAFWAARQTGRGTPELLYHLAAAQLAAGQLGEARRSAAEALEVTPDDQQPAVRELLARIESSQQQRETWR